MKNNSEHIGMFCSIKDAIDQIINSRLQNKNACNDPVYIFLILAERFTNVPSVLLNLVQIVLPCLPQSGY